MRLCAAGFTLSQRNPRYLRSVVGRSILTEACRTGRVGRKPDGGAEEAVNELLLYSNNYFALM